MRLSDIVSNMELTVFPEIGLALFFGVFVLVTIRALRADRGEILEQAALPLAAEREFVEPELSENDQ